MIRRQFQRQHEAGQRKLLRTTVRTHLSADALIATVRGAFEQVSDSRKGKPGIPMADALMSAYAMFSLKDPSVLAFEKHWKEDESNLRSIYKIGTIPSDTQMRAIGSIPRLLTRIFSGIPSITPGIELQLIPQPVAFHDLVVCAVVLGTPQLQDVVGIGGIPPGARPL
jgi:hypothetical protein